MENPSVLDWSNEKSWRARVETVFLRQKQYTRNSAVKRIEFRASDMKGYSRMEYKINDVGKNIIINTQIQKQF